MKFRSSLSAILVILVAELIGLAGIIYMQQAHHHYACAYEDIVVASTAEKDDVSKLKQLIYEHEFYTLDYLSKSKTAEESELKEKTVNCEIQIRKQLFEHGDFLKKFRGDEKEKLYRDVNDDILDYLNYNAVLVSMNEESSAEELSSYIEKNVHPLIEQVDESMGKLSALSDVQVQNAKKTMDESSLRFKLVFVLCFAILLVNIIISIIHSFKVINGLETDRKVAEFQSELSKIKVSSIQHNTIIGIADLIENRSGETGQHVKRTIRYVSLLANKAFEKKMWPEVLTKNYIDLIIEAAPLHDVGKIVISDAVLNKPGKLTPEEFEIIKTHTTEGAKIVGQILGGVGNEKYLAIASDIAHYHHEKWNGKGYPCGLKGEEIPLCARIMAVADVYDALVSERCYKKPMKFEDAVQLIQSEAGEHFDPAVVELFLELKDKFNEKE